MTTRITAYTDATAKIYHPNPAHQQGLIYVVALMLPLLALIPAAVISRDLKTTGTLSISAIVLVGIIIGVALFALRYAKRYVSRTCWILSVNGLEYYGPGVILKTRWDNAKEITTSTQLHLILRHRADVYRRWLPSRDPFADQRIPLYLFDFTPHSPLADDLQQFAPHLFNIPHGVSYGFVKMVIALLLFQCCCNLV